MDGFDPKTSFDYETSKRYDALETRGDEEDTVAVLAQLAGQQDALEFAVGTGRIDSPLVRAGVPVDGIEQSQHMVDRMREQPDGDNVNVVIGDLSRVSTGRRYGLVYCRGSPGPAARVRPAGAGQTLITRRILWAAAMRS